MKILSIFLLINSVLDPVALAVGGDDELSQESPPSVLSTQPPYSDGMCYSREFSLELGASGVVHLPPENAQLAENPFQSPPTEDPFMDFSNSAQRFDRVDEDENETYSCCSCLGALW